MTTTGPDAEVHDLAQRVLSTLISEEERKQRRVALLVERRRVGAAWAELIEHDDTDLSTVSLGYPGSSREVWVDIVREDRTRSLAEAASVLADAFQDEVIELLHEARPTCRGHAHPMLISRDASATSWCCPINATERQAIWP